MDSHEKVFASFFLPGRKATGLLVATLLLLAIQSRGQTTFTNLTVTISASDLRDRLYDASASSALSQAPIQAAVLHLMNEATTANPGILSASNALAVMQNVVSDMTNAAG